MIILNDKRQRNYWMNKINSSTRCSVAIDLRIDWWSSNNNDIWTYCITYTFEMIEQNNISLLINFIRIWWDWLISPRIRRPMMSTGKKKSVCIFEKIPFSFNIGGYVVCHQKSSTCTFLLLILFVFFLRILLVVNFNSFFSAIFLTLWNTKRNENEIGNSFSLYTHFLRLPKLIVTNAMCLCEYSIFDRILSISV